MNKMPKIILYLLVLLFLVSLGWGGYTLIQKLTTKELERLAQESRTQETESALEKREFEISGQPKAVQEASFFLTSEKEEIKVGESFNLQVWVNGQNEIVDGAEFIIHFDPGLVKIDEPQLGAFFSLFYPFKKVDQEQGEIRVVALQDLEENKTLGEELVAEFLVTGLNKGQVDFTFDLEKTHIACCGGQELLKKAAPLTIKID